MTTTPAELDSTLVAARRDRSSTTALWDAYVAIWSAGIPKDVREDDFNRLFFRDEIAGDALELMATSNLAKRGISASCEYLPRCIGYSDTNRRVFFAATEADEAVQTWRNNHQKWPAGDRCKRAENLVRGLVGEKGREWTRNKVRLLWSDGTIEEERQAFLGGLQKGEAITPGFLRLLGPNALALAQSVGIYDTNDVTVDSAGVLPNRLQPLLQTLRVPLDILDAGLRVEELERLTPKQNLGTSLIRSIQLLRKHIPEEVQQALGAAIEVAKFREDAIANGRKELSVPVLQLLHMRMIVEAPALADGLQRPQDHLVPEVLLYMLVRDGVTYVPELRIPSGDVRWSSKWVEASAEALCLIFLEQAIDLDLPTVARIREQQQQTADFCGQTRGGERTIFEAKGTKRWETHETQRKKALQQVRASMPAKRSLVSSGGRGFACCLFAAAEGDPRSSLFHVADPSIDEEVFYDGWETDARRRHYAAVAEAAGLFRLADRLLQDGLRRRQEPSATQAPQEAEQDEYVVFRFSENDEGQAFVGRERALEDEARAFRLPSPERFRGAKLFVGLPQALYKRLERGEIPSKPLGEKGDNAMLPAFGVLPGEGSLARGVYSLLSDGSFVAIEMPTSSELT